MQDSRTATSGAFGDAEALWRSTRLLACLPGSSELPHWESAGQARATVFFAEEGRGGTLWGMSEARTPEEEGQGLPREVEPIGRCDYVTRVNAAALETDQEEGASGARGAFPHTGAGATAILPPQQDVSLLRFRVQPAPALSRYTAMIHQAVANHAKVVALMHESRRYAEAASPLCQLSSETIARVAQNMRTAENVVNPIMGEFFSRRPEQQVGIDPALLATFENAVRFAAAHHDVFGLARMASELQSRTSAALSNASDRVAAVEAGSVADLNAEIQRLLSAGRVSDARAIAARAASRMPGSDVFAQWQEVLAPPRARLAGKATGRSRRSEQAWLREHAQDYKGQWVALRGDMLIAAGRLLQEVRERARKAAGLTEILFHFVPEDP